MRGFLLAVCATIPLGLAACHEEGPAERAGRNLDRAGDRVSDAVNPPKGPVESAGRKVDRALGR